MLDFHWITDALAVGAYFPMELAEELAREHGVRCIVDVREESCDDPAVLARCGLELLHLPTPDMTGITLSRMDEGVAWIDERLTQGKRVLVHCQHGVGRSTLLCACVLVQRGSSPLDALRLAKSKRREMALSVDQQLRFVEWCRRHPRAPKWDLPTPLEIQQIVWAPH